MDFKDEFEAIAEKTKQLTGSGIRKADEMFSVSKLKLECIRIDNTIKTKYAELGKMMYNMVKDDNADSEKISDAVMEIDRLYKKMAQVNEKIEEVKKIVTCPECGTKNKFTSNYCSSCRHKLVCTDEEPEDYSYHLDVDTE